MSVIPLDFGSKPARRWFWPALADRLNALFSYPAKHAVSEQELRRVDEDIKRCRQLMFQKQQRELKLVNATARRHTKMRHG